MQQASMVGMQETLGNLDYDDSGALHGKDAQMVLGNCRSTPLIYLERRVHMLPLLDTTSMLKTSGVVIKF